MPRTPLSPAFGRPLEGRARTPRGPSRFAFGTCVVAVVFASPLARAYPMSLISSSEEITAVSSKVHNGYTRAKLPDGSFRPETYALAIGGFVGVRADETIDNLSFDSISHTLASSLADQKYIPTHDLDRVQLLVVVYWGTTYGTNSGPMLGGLKDAIDLKNALKLGFDSEKVFGDGFGDPSNIRSEIMRQTHTEAMSAIEMDRYYVILIALDFQAALRQKKVRLLWETRISLSERHHDFTKELPLMAQYASQYFGQESHGLIMKPVPEGRVDVGDVKSLGALPDKANRGSGAPDRP
jgi:hypothetical protein